MSNANTLTLDVDRNLIHIFGHLAFLESSYELRLGRLCRLVIVKARHDLHGQLEFHVARIHALVHFLFERIDFVNAAKAQ